jgi:hypothetical protein
MHTPPVIPEADAHSGGHPGSAATSTFVQIPDSLGEGLGFGDDG